MSLVHFIIRLLAIMSTVGGLFFQGASVSGGLVFLRHFGSKYIVCDKSDHRLKTEPLNLTGTVHCSGACHIINEFTEKSFNDGTTQTTVK